MSIARRVFPGAGIGLLGLLLGGLSVGLLATRQPALGLVPPLALVLLIALARAPEAGFCFLVGYLPFQNYTTLVMVGGYDFFTIQKVVGAGIVLVLAVSAVAAKRPAASLRSELWVWLAGLWIAGFVSFLLSDHRLAAATEVRRQSVDLLYFTLSLVFLARPRLFARTVPAVIVASVTASALLSIVGYAFRVEQLSLNVYQAEDLLRAQGGSHDPNYFASLIVFSLPFLVHWYHVTARLAVRVLCLVLAGVATAAVILTFSRGGFLILGAFVALAGFEYLRNLRPRHLGFFTLVAAAGIVLLALFVPRSFWERQLTTFTRSEMRTDVSLARRLSYLEVGWREFLARPLLGAGPGTFPELYAATAVAQDFAVDENDLRRVAHNSYVNQIVGTGAIGFFFFIGAIVVAYRAFRRAEALFREAGEERLVSLTKAYKIAFLTLLITFLTLDAQNNKYFWLSLGFSQAALHLARARAGRA